MPVWNGLFAWPVLMLVAAFIPKLSKLPAAGELWSCFTCLFKVLWSTQTTKQHAEQENQWLLLLLWTNRLQNTPHNIQSPQQPGPWLPFWPPPPPRPNPLPQVRRRKHAEDHQDQAPDLGWQGVLSCCPSLWNALPIHIRQAPTLPSFKKALKTHLFKIAFSC